LLALRSGAGRYVGACETEKGMSMKHEAIGVVVRLDHYTSVKGSDFGELPETQMSKLKVASTKMQFMILALLILAAGVTVFNILTGAWADFLRIPADIALNHAQISGIGLLTVIVVGLITPLAFLLAFCRLYHLLDLYRNGKVFTTENVIAIQNMGWSLVAIDIANTVQFLIAGPALNFFQIADGYFMLSIDLAFLTVGLFIVLVSRVMDLGRELKKQNSLVI